MHSFLILAALMAVLAAGVVAVPLMRHRDSRLAGAVAALIVISAAAALYPLWSNWDWHAEQGQAAAPDVLAMVAKLEGHLRDNPQDLTGWLMLGRSYVTLERPDDAIVAYDHAHRIDAGNADAALGLGEALSLRARGNITPPAAALFEEALRLAPENPKALLYGGVAAEARGDTAAARARWQALKALHPPQRIDKMLDERIAALGSGAAAGTPLRNGGAQPAQAVQSTSQAGQSASQAEQSASNAQAIVNISIAPLLKARLKADAPLFVFAREPGGRGAPLAAKRMTSAAIGTQILLTAADSMIPGRSLARGQRVSITARVSFSGQPLPAAGDLFGELTYDVGHDGARDLVIDQVAE